MNLNQLIYFQAICNYKTITKAAEHLNISQPSISVAIKDLEYELGVNLFKRDNNKLLITAEGEFFLNRVNKILGDINDLYLTIRDMGEYNSTIIKLGVPPIVGICLFPKIFSEFTKINPNIKFELYENYHLDLRTMVEDGIIDFSFTIMDDDFYNDNLTVDFITDLEVCFCVKKNNPLAQNRVVNIELIKDEPVIFYKKDSYHYKILIELYEKNNHKPNIVFSSNRPRFIKDYIINNNASAFIERLLISENDDIVPISFEKPIIIKTGLVWKKHRTMFKKNKTFHDFVIDLYK